MAGCSSTLNPTVAIASLALACGGIEETPPGVSPQEDASPADVVAPDRTPSDVAVVDTSDPDVFVPPGTCARAAGKSGSEMVEVPAPDGTTYCIDRTEVTQGQYFEFLAAKGAGMSFPDYGDTSGQPPGCEFNHRFTPDWTSENDPNCRLEHNDGTAFDYDKEHPNYPVGCVDWCDAYMYCQWAGKRLCGAIGGGTLDPVEKINAAKNQWFNACSQGGKTSYPYGDEFQPGLCSDWVYAEAIAPGEPLNLGYPSDATPRCHGVTSPFERVLDMSGNMTEWIDACKDETGQGELFTCLLYGPMTGPEEPEGYRCDASSPLLRDMRIPALGFRCCLD